MEKVINVYINASMSQLSIARHSGGAIVNGKKYIWDYANDSLVLKSYKKEWAKIAEKKPLWR